MTKNNKRLHCQCSIIEMFMWNIGVIKGHQKIL